MSLKHPRSSAPLYPQLTDRNAAELSTVAELVKNLKKVYFGSVKNLKKVQSSSLHDTLIVRDGVLSNFYRRKFFRH